MRKSYASFYITDSIAEKNSIVVSPEDIKQVATQDAIRNGLNVKDVIAKLEKDEKMQNYLSFTIKEAKVYDFVYDNVNKNVKKLDRKSFEKAIEEEQNKNVKAKK